MQLKKTHAYEKYETLGRPYRVKIWKEKQTTFILYCCNPKKLRTNKTKTQLTLNGVAYKEKPINGNPDYKLEGDKLIWLRKDIVLTPNDYLEIEIFVSKGNNLPINEENYE